MLKETSDDKQLKDNKRTELNGEEMKRMDKKGDELHPKGKMSRDLVIGLIIGLLVLQVLLGGYQVVSGIIQERAAAAQRTQLLSDVAKYTATVDQLTTQMLSDYKKEVYNSDAVNTTAKQEVLGTEYNFMALMLVAKQNSRLMEILAQAR
jgi:hypothetical protein